MNHLQYQSLGDESKRLFGLIGYPLSHSFSKKYFDKKFSAEKIDNAFFELFSIEKIEALHEILKLNKNLSGLAVTIPYKKEVLPFLDETDELVNKTGACNCISIRSGKLCGYNTDIMGFEGSFKKNISTHHNKALVLGTGGAATAVEFVLKKMNIPYRSVSRKNNEADVLTYDQLNKDILQEYSIIINTTPVGTYPNVEEAPALPYEFITKEHYLFDLVYNPAETKFLQLGKEKGAVTQNGYDMLVLQAEENWRIWNK